MDGGIKGLLITIGIFGGMIILIFLCALLYKLYKKCKDKEHVEELPFF
jgi:hypothetical protein